MTLSIVLKKIKRSKKMNKKPGGKIMEIYNTRDLEAGEKYLLLDEATDERWIAELCDKNWDKKPEDYEVFYKLLSTNTDREIKDSEGDSSIESFMEENRLRVFKLDSKEPDAKSEEINREIRKLKEVKTE